MAMGFQEQKKPDYRPMFFSMADEWKDIESDESIFEFSVKSSDTSLTTEIEHQVRLLSNSLGEPRLFFSEIETSVCADGECKLANIKVYWNLLGNYVGYGTYDKYPLTKFEHDPFEKADYQKLHKLLLDDNSVLKRRKMSDLIDKIPVSLSNINSKDLDGISGATKKEIKESVVKGGLYSCYTIWHLVHGDAKKKIRKHLETIGTDDLKEYFLYSLYKDYQIYGLKQLSQADFRVHSKQIVSIFKSTNALTRTYILKKLPTDLYSEKEITNQLYTMFPGVDLNSKTLLINKLEFAASDAIEILAGFLDNMTKNQLKHYLKYLEENTLRITNTMKRNLRKVSKDKNYAHSYLIDAFLKTNK